MAWAGIGLDSLSERERNGWRTRRKEKFHWISFRSPYLASITPNGEWRTLLDLWLLMIVRKSHNCFRGRKKTLNNTNQDRRGEWKSFWISLLCTIQTSPLFVELLKFELCLCFGRDLLDFSFSPSNIIDKVLSEVCENARFPRYHFLNEFKSLEHT